MKQRKLPLKIRRQLRLNSMRQYISGSEPDAFGQICVTGKDYRYLKQVLRLRPGDNIDVRLPSGKLQPMVVVSSGARQLVLEPVAAGTNNRDAAGRRAVETGVSAAAIADGMANRIPLWLIQFLPKNQKMDVIVRQATEIGVSIIIPVLGCRSPSGDGNRMDRWDRIIREARQQSGSPVATKIHAPCSLALAVELWQQEKGDKPCGFVLYEKTNGSCLLHEAVAAESGVFSAAAVAVGCEGGIAPDELNVLQQAGFIPVHFYTNILRTETATVYGLSALQTVLTERNVWQLKESIS